MESSEISGWLPDVNVWLSLCPDCHEHRGAALNWLAAIRAPVYFCRVTQMSLLRLLTNPRVMGTDILTPRDAIGVCRELRGDERLRDADEPSDAERPWLSMMTDPRGPG